MFLWRHNYVTPWPIVLILVCVNREDPYLPIVNKINFMGGFGSENLGRGLQQPSLVRRVTKIAWLDEGYIRATNSKQNLLKITKAFKQISEILVSDWWNWV